jgi:hypothetical protein
MAGCQRVSSATHSRSHDHPALDLRPRPGRAGPGDSQKDWARKEQVRAVLRRNIRRLLTKYHYPPDKQESAVQLVMRQAEVFADETSMDLDSDQSVGSA